MRHTLTVALMSGAFCGCANLSERNLSQSDQAKNKFEVRLNMARLQERQGALTKARAMFEQMAAEHPDNAELHHRLMVIYTRLDLSELATQQFELARGLNPDNADLFADRGYALYLAGDLEQAESLLKHAYELNPQNERVVINLATVTGALGQVNESWSLFRRVLEDAEAHANVGFILMQRGELGMAKKHYSIALNLDPKSRAAKNALYQIAQWEQKQRTAKTRQAAVATPTLEPSQNAAPVQLAASAHVAAPELESEPEQTPWFGATQVTLSPTPPVVPISTETTKPANHPLGGSWQLPTTAMTP